MSGLFVVLGTVFVASLLAAVAGRISRRRNRIANEARGAQSVRSVVDDLAMMTDAEMLRKIYETVAASAAQQYAYNASTHEEDRDVKN